MKYQVRGGALVEFERVIEAATKAEAYALAFEPVSGEDLIPREGHRVEWVEIVNVLPTAPEMAWDRVIAEEAEL